MLFFMTTNKKQQCYPLCIFSWRPIKNISVTPYFFFMTTNKKQQCYPLCFIWQRQQCYLLCFFSWLPIKNYSVTPYVYFHDDQRKTTVLPPMFYLMIIDSVTPYVYFMTADKKRVTPHVFSMLTNKKRLWYPCRRFCGDPNLSGLECKPLNLSMHHQDTEKSLHNGYTWLYNSREIEIRVCQQRTSTRLEPRSPGG